MFDNELNVGFSSYSCMTYKYLTLHLQGVHGFSGILDIPLSPIRNRAGLGKMLENLRDGPASIIFETGLGKIISYRTYYNIAPVATTFLSQMCMDCSFLWLILNLSNP